MLKPQIWTRSSRKGIKPGNRSKKKPEEGVLGEDDEHLQRGSNEKNRKNQKGILSWKIKKKKSFKESMAETVK